MDNNAVFTPAEIKEIVGRAFVVNSEGRSIAAQEGTPLKVGDVLLTPEGSKVVVLINGEPVVVDQNCVSCIKAPESANQEPSLESEQVAGQLAVNQTVEQPELDIEAIQAAILAGEDPTEILEATAAGGATGGSANAGFITIEYDEASTIANIDFDTEGFAHNAGLARLEEAGDDVIIRPAAPIANVDETGVTQEDSVLSANGILGVSNSQTNLSYSWAISGSPEGTYGSLEVDPITGAWLYSLNNLDTVTQALAEGQTETETFSVIVTDSAGGSDTQQVIISVLGTNDLPTISGTSAAELTEGNIGDSDPEANEQLTVNDVDALDTHNWSIVSSSAGTYGDLSLDQSGAWKYVLDNSLSTTQGLNKDQRVDEIFQVQVSDNHGGIATQTITVTVVGTNDLPVIEGESSGVAVEDLVVQASGKLNLSDLDTNDDLTGAITDPNGTYGVLSYDNATTTWTYDLTTSSTVTQELNEGQIATEQFTIVVKDSFGGETSQTITITVTGTNDLPEIINTSVVEGGVTEDVAANLQAKGQLTFTDADAETGHTWKVLTDNNSPYGDFTVDGNGEWTFNLTTAADEVQALGEGITKDLIYTVEIKDPQGATDTVDVKITITGTNDDPSISGTHLGSVVEDTLNSATGTLTSTDADAGDTANWSITSPGGTYGDLTQVDGTWTYNLNNNKTATQALNKGEIQTDVFEVVVTDSEGAEAKQTITITVTGTNDLPEITNTSVVLGDVVEDDAANLQAKGQLDFTDVDAETGHTWKVLTDNNSPYGDFSVGSSSGEWTFDLTTNADEVQALGKGDTHDIFYTVEVKDPQGATDTVVVKVTVTGTNDDPTISGSHLGSVVEDTLNSATGTLTSSDVDVGDGASWSITAPGGTYGDLTQVDGTWTYNLDNNKTATQSLNAGEIKTDVFEMVVIDGEGGEAKQTITITVTGTNDLPEIAGSSVVTGGVTEDVAAKLQAKGQLAFTDADAETGHTWQVLTDNNSPYGNFSVGSSSGEWTFDLTTNADEVQALGKGDTHDIFYTVEVKDPQGATDTVVVKVTVTGTNDDPTISGSHLGSVVEDTLNTATGTLTSTDVDVGDGANWSITTPGGTYGDLTNVNGTWTYTLDNTKLATQALAEGEKQTDVFEMVVTDGEGGSDTQTITITVTGTNDDPVIDGGNDRGEVVEDGKLIATDTLTVTDDSGDSHTWSLIGDTSSKYGSIVVGATTGTWTYTLDNAAAQELAVTDTITETYVIQADDGKGGTVQQIVEITIKGDNDIPTIKGTLLGNTVEDILETVTGVVTAEDVDLADGHSWSIDGATQGTYGDISITSEGTWTYTLDPSLKATQQLQEDQLETDTFTIKTDDGHGGTATETIVINVLGTNDTPNIKGKLKKSIEEDETSVKGTLKHGDVDIGDDHEWTILGSNQGIYGSLSIVENANGKARWTYKLDNDSEVTQALEAGEEHIEIFAVQVEDEFGAIDTVNLKITVIGTNDTPLMSGELTGSITEDASPDSITGQLLPDDIDNVNGGSDTHTWLIAGEDGTYGSIGIDDDGLWTYELDNTKESVQKLGEGITATEIFNVTVTDNHGASTTKQIEITITGSNDAPSIKGATTTSTIEDVIGKDTGTGDLVVVDIDQGDTHNWSVVGEDNATGIKIGIYGDLQVDDNGTWFYQLDNDREATEAIPSGETVSEVFTIEVIDQHGAKGTIEVTINVAGHNTDPSISGTLTGTIVEDATPDVVEGSAIDGDFDLIDTHDWEIIGSTGAYGTLTLNDDGTWKYKLDNNNSKVDELDPGDHIEDTIAIRVTDSFGQTSESEIKITIEGANDAPDLRGALIGSVNEDTKVSASGQLHHGDPDKDDTHDWELVSGVGEYGNLILDSDNKWHYSLTNTDPRVQALGVGESLTETFTVKVTDDHGETSSKPVTITINGTNDVPTIEGGAEVDYIEDESSTSITGQVLTHDIDGDDVTFTAHTFTGTFGRFSLNSDGSWSYRIDPNLESVQSLNEGESHQETFPVSATDGNGGTVNDTIIINIKGTNDIPEISGADEGAVAAGAQFADFRESSGQLNAHDVDLGDTIVSWQAIDGKGTYGTFTVDANGEWTYTLDNLDPDTLALVSGDKVTETFQVTATDSHGGVSLPQTVTIDVLGTQSADGGGTDGSTILDPIIINPEEDRHPDESGQIDLDQFCNGGNGNGNNGNGNGNDNNNGHHGEGNQGNGNGNGGGTGGTGGIDTVTANPVNGGVFGQLVVDTDGRWTYELDNDSILVDSLCEGDEVTETWKIQITDDCGETYTIPVTITITGTNDAPIIGGLNLGDVTEDTQLSFTGQLEGIDPDKCDDQAWTVDDADGTYGSLVLNPTTGEWTYTLDPKVTDPSDPNYAASQVIQELDPGDTIQETFQVTVTDNYGETATQEVIVTIHGTADDVTITDNVIAVTAFEEDGTLTDTGNLTTPDGLDNPVTWSAVNGSGSYGTLTLTTDGEWTYLLNNSSNAVQSLAEGVTVTDSFEVTVVDQFGSTVVDDSGNPTTMLINVDVTGTNDAPDIKGDLVASIDNDAAVNEISGTLNDGDVDSGDTHIFSGDNQTNEYGTFHLDSNGHWTFTLDQTNQEVINLGKGATIEVEFIVGVTDGHSLPAPDGGIDIDKVVITIEGSNKPPVIEGDLVMELKEDGKTTEAVPLQLDGTDPNTGDTVVFEAKTLAGTYGTFTLQADGQWNYQLNNSAPHVQSLREGSVVSETFIVKATDNHGASTSSSVTVNITGTNDLPELSGRDNGVLSENPGQAVSGIVTASDVDKGDSSDYSIDNELATAAKYGTAFIDASGRWTYTVNSLHADVDGLSQGEKLTDTFVIVATDTANGEGKMTITVTINGVNDAPNIEAVVTEKLVEDSVTSLTGTFLDGDPDKSDTHTWQVTDSDPLADLTVDNNGSWSINLHTTDPLIQQLKEGEELTLTYTLKVTDQHGVSDTKDVSFIVVGSNDDPVITVDSEVIGSVSEDTLPNSVSGQMEVTDIDVKDTHQWSVQGTGQGTYGSMSIDPSSGLWTYTIGNGLDETQKLAEGISKDEVFTIDVFDGTDTVSQQVTITVTGSNDIPKIDPASVIIGEVTEDAATTFAEGQLVISDLDVGDSYVWSVKDGADTGTYGTISVDEFGKWTYNINNSLTQSLAENEKQDEVFTLQVFDGTDTVEQVVTVTVVGTNDAPEISGTTTGEATDGYQNVVTGELVLSDAESDAMSWKSVADMPGTYGTLSFGSIDALTNRAIWTFTLTAGSTLALAAGVKATESFDVFIIDGEGGETKETITVTVVGTDSVLGGVGNDILTGTTADEVMWGGPVDLSDAGTSDTFLWNSTGVGSVGTPSHDVIKDFDVNSDKVDLSDLFGFIGAADVSVLTNQLIVTETNGNAELQVMDGATVVQTITLDGVGLDSLLTAPSAGMSNEERLNDLINGDQLDVARDPVTNNISDSASADTLIGTGDNDIFLFSAANSGQGNAPVIDTVQNFDLSADKLDISEILPGIFTEADSGDIFADYLNITVDENNTTISVKSDLLDINSDQADIVLEGVGFADLGFADASVSSDQLVAKLYDDLHVLKID
ncbi:retention module-containing protein [Aliivibrio kagoshimensis]|uniref:retention module-containing protein n=1 Tax=Aliivibrio kagoshimensis TaxID=2910230 RepID=UPI003D14029E